MFQLRVVSVSGGSVERARVHVLLYVLLEEVGVDLLDGHTASMVCRRIDAVEVVRQVGLGRLCVGKWELSTSLLEIVFC